MNRPFKISNTTLRIILYHLYKKFNLFDELKDIEDQYDVFKQLAIDKINELTA